MKHGAEAQIQPANLFDPPYTMVVIVLYSNILEQKTIILKTLSCCESERCVSSIRPGEGSNWNWEPSFPVSGAGGENEGES